jgi:hypothetical protein
MCWGVYENVDGSRFVHFSQELPEKLAVATLVLRCDTQAQALVAAGLAIG